MLGLKRAAVYRGCGNVRYLMYLKELARRVGTRKAKSLIETTRRHKRELGRTRQSIATGRISQTRGEADRPRARLEIEVYEYIVAFSHSLDLALSHFQEMGLRILDLHVKATLFQPISTSCRRFAGTLIR